MAIAITGLNHIHKAIAGFCKVIKEEGLPSQLPEAVHCPSEVFDVAALQARQFYPTVRFIREPEFESFLTVARDPLEVS